MAYQKLRMMNHHQSCRPAPQKCQKKSVFSHELWDKIKALGYGVSTFGPKHMCGWRI